MFGFPFKYGSPYFLRESHGRWADCRVLRQQRLQVGGEGVLRVDAVQPVGDAAENGVGAGLHNAVHVDPRIAHCGRQHWNHCHGAVPHAGMVGTGITQSIDSPHPTFQGFVFSHSETAGNTFLGWRVSEIHIELRQAAERHQLQHLPRRREVRRAVLRRVLLDELFLRALQLPLQRVQILGELRLVDGQRRIEEPERLVRQRTDG